MKKSKQTTSNLRVAVIVSTIYEDGKIKTEVNNYLYSPGEPHEITISVDPGCAVGITFIFDDWVLLPYSFSSVDYARKYFTKDIEGAFTVVDAGNNIIDPGPEADRPR